MRTPAKLWDLATSEIRMKVFQMPHETQRFLFPKNVNREDPTAAFKAD